MHKRLSTNGWKHLKIAIIIFFYRYQCVHRSFACILVHRKHYNVHYTAQPYSKAIKRTYNLLCNDHPFNFPSPGIICMSLALALALYVLQYVGHRICLSNHLIRPTLKVGGRISTFICVQPSSSTSSFLYAGYEDNNLMCVHTDA